MPNVTDDHSIKITEEILVGRRIRDERKRQGLSLRSLAGLSNLNINTLCLIENGKTSPSVSTLQQLASALSVPIVTFFENEPEDKLIVYTPAGQRPSVSVGSTIMQNLGQELAGSAVQAFIVTLQPWMGSGDQPIVHTGFEFVYCIEGAVHYRIQNEDYYLLTGDSLVFAAYLPHCWENIDPEMCKIILVICSPDEHDNPVGKHMKFTQKKETFEQTK